MSELTDAQAIKRQLVFEAGFFPAKIETLPELFPECDQYVVVNGNALLP